MEPIAVLGLGALLPGARTIDEFWQNILSKTVSISRLPEAMFEREVFYRPELLNVANKQDKSVTQIAGWIDDLAFDTVRRYKIPPSVAEHMDTNQHAALYTAGQALAMNNLANVAKERVAVVFGNGMVGTRYGDALFRVHFALMEHALRRHPNFRKLQPAEQDEIVAAVAADVLKDTIPITEDSAPGVLPNIIAARIASVFDFHGPSFTVDAACASVLAAAIKGIQGLQLREYDAVICGGADMPLKQLGFILFSALNALSPNGSYPFDRRADGFVMGQGAGAVILKRLADAVADGDRVLAVITGYGEASDGKGKYIAAPNAQWQASAIEKAMRMAGYSPDTVEMVEAHGTATRVGDVVEVEGLKLAWERLGAREQQRCGLTSVKSNIGHLKSAAGIASLIKAVLALQHATLAPTASFAEINPKLGLEGSPFYVIEEARPWPASEAHPRRAGVSSFGFGGADYHLALQEYRPGDYRPQISTGVVLPATVSGFAAPMASPCADSAPAEAVFFSGADREALDRAVRAFQSRDLPWPERCWQQNFLADASLPVRLAVVAADLADLAARYEEYTTRGQVLAPDLLRARNLYPGSGAPAGPDQIAFLFPGQASQYPGMFRDLAEGYDTIRTWFRRVDAYWIARHGAAVTDMMYGRDLPEADALERLRRTENVHPAIFASSFALYHLLRQMELEAKFYAGHSLGEIVALGAAGFLSADDALRLVEARGYAFHDAQLPDAGKMLSVMAARAETEALIAESGAVVRVANVNSPRQTVVAGGSADVEVFQRFVEGRGVTNRLLFVSHAFHTPLLQPVADCFQQAIRDLRFQPSDRLVMMNHTGTLYPTGAEGVAQLPGLLRDQILAPVNFARSLQLLYDMGARIFVEVGPGSVLSSFAKDTLPYSDVRILTANHKNTDAFLGIQRLLAGLFAEGVPVKPVLARSASSVRVELGGASSLAPGSSPRSQPRPADLAPDVPAPRERVVYAGVAIGLPGSWKAAFRDDNFDQLFSGRNLIERLTDDEKQQMVDLQITRLVKDDSGPAFKALTALDDVIQLAGKIGRIDPIGDYALDEKTVENMSSAIALGVAAGYEALRDARIPLVQEQQATTTGKLLPGKLALPLEMQDETGVIFANGFPLIDPVIREVSRFVAHKYGSKTRRELMAFYESLIERVKDPTARKLLTDWYALYYMRLTENLGEEDVFRFNHHFMTQISAQANNLLASLINARGPNFQMNAACSSTSNAITIAEDFIRSGRVKRMLVVGADDASSPLSLALLGAGFLCTGAATSEADLYKAAIPFDRRRNGMIIGAGAVGIVLEASGEVAARGVTPACELVATHSFNTARHVSQIDSEIFARELERFIERTTLILGLSRAELARRTIYISHETFTPPRGGCSQTEAEALSRAFGDDYRHIIVGNTKGMTGHTMGASLEDAVAARSLLDGRCPPVVNLGERDPLLGQLNLWGGGVHDRTFALKMSAGFGAQGHFALLQKTGSGSERIADASRHAAWLRRVTGDPAAEPGLLGRLYVARRAAPAAPRVVESSARRALEPAERLAAPQQSEPASLASPASEPDKNALLADALRVFSEVTKYPVDMLDPDMALEADLGIDSLKQATILAILAEKYMLERDAGLQLSNYPTIRRLVDLIHERGRFSGPPSAPSAGAPAAVTLPTTLVSSGPARPAPAPGPEHPALALLADLSGYPPEMLEPEMEFAADLGIPDEKLHMIAARLAEAFGLNAGLSLTGEMTVGALLEHLAAEPARPAAAPTVHTWHSDLSRQAPVLVDAPLGSSDFDLAGRVAWVLGDDEADVAPVITALRARGADAAPFLFAPAQDALGVQTAFASFAAGRSADLIVDWCTGGRPSPRFAVYKALAAGAGRPARILAVVTGDGAFGLDPASSRALDPWCGAMAGFYKSLRKEWTGTIVRVLDLGPADGSEHPAAIEHLMAEIAHAGPGVEIGYAGGLRRAIQLHSREHVSHEPLNFSARDTILLTGGGTGVTARVLLALAQAYPASFIVVDVIELPADVAALARLDDAGTAELRGEVETRLRAAEARVTPAMIHREYDRLLQAIEVQHNLEALRQLGRRVVYIACDVRDAARLKPLLDDARRQLGPITGLVHAAGVDASHLLAQKSIDEFERVLSVKAEGALTVARLLHDDPLRLVVAFGSIAGRFGNAAQLDYAAANDFLSYWVRSLRRSRPGLHAVCLVWSGWKDVGIAWRNEFVRRHAESSGLNFIEVEQGTAAFLSEATGPTADAEVVLHRGLNGFLEPGLVDHYLPELPLIDRVTTAAGQVDRAYRLFSVQRDGLLDQHRLGKTPILPAVGYAELAAEHFALREGRRAQYLLRDMTFPAAFKLFREAPRELYVEGAPAGDGAWAVTVKSAFRPPRAPDAQVVLHSSAIVSAGPPDLSGMDPSLWPFQAGTPTSLPAEQSLMLIQNEGPQQRIILGPLFNDALRDASAKEPVLIYPSGTVYPTYFPLEQLDNPRYPLDRLLVNPCFLDSIYQACAANLLVVRKRVYLPWHIDTLGIVDPPRRPGLYVTYAQVVAESDEVVSFDIAMLDGDKRIRYFARNARFRLINL